MRTFSPAALADSNAVSSSIPWLIFLDIPFLGEPAFYVRNNENITWNGIVYTASEFDISAIPAKSTGELPEITLSIMNTAPLVKELEEYYGYIGTGVIVYYVHYASIGTIPQADWPLRFSFKVINCTITRDQVTFILGVPNYLKQKFPQQKYHKDTCPYLYKGDYCWMKGKTRVTAADQCNHLFEPYEKSDPNYYADPGCKAHFNDLAESNRPHYTSGSGTITYIPFGGFPTIGKGSYRYG